jgi:hypothetical protein
MRMPSVNLDSLVVAKEEFVWTETWQLRKAAIGPSYSLFLAKRVTSWTLGFPLALAAAIGLRAICGHPEEFSHLPADFHEFVIYIVSGAITGLAFEYAPLTIQISKYQILIIQSYRVFWRLLFRREMLVRVTPIAPQITRMDFYLPGRARPKMIRGCPFEAAKVVEWFHAAGINVELEGTQHTPPL